MPSFLITKAALNVDGVEFWLSAWLKVSKDGQKFMSLSIKNKNADASLNKPKKASFDDSMCRSDYEGKVVQRLFQLADEQ
jgi:hypothetical protein